MEPDSLHLRLMGSLCIQLIDELITIAAKESPSGLSAKKGTEA